MADVQGPKPEVGVLATLPPTQGGNPLITQDIAKVMIWQAKVLIEGGVLPSRYRVPAQILPVFMLADELGVGRITAVRQMYIIDQKPALETGLMMALIHRTGQLTKLEISDDGKACTVFMERGGKFSLKETFSMDDAAAAGLLNKDNWKKYPKLMRRWRAISACARVLFSDVMSGMYTLEELDAPTRIVGGEIVLDDGGLGTPVAEVAADKPEAEPVPAKTRSLAPAPKDPTPAKNPRLGKKPKETEQPTSVKLRTRLGELYKTLYPGSKNLILSDAERARINAKLSENKDPDYWQKMIATVEKLVQERLAQFEDAQAGVEPEDQTPVVENDSEVDYDEDEDEDLEFEGDEDEDEDEEEGD